MNKTVLQLKEMRRAMRVYVLMLYEMAFEMKPENVLEIGTGQCQSTRVIASALEENKKGKLITVDTGNRESRFNEYSHLKPYVQFIIGDSHSEEVFNQVPKVEYDMLLIDGDHSYKGVKKDFEMYAPLVKERGLILLHDITNTDQTVYKFWKEIKYPKVGLEYGWTKYGGQGGMIPGMGIVQVINYEKI